MRLKYVLLADAVNNGPDGKLNVLGIGVRQVRPQMLPALLQVVLLASAEATREEFGEHRVRVSMVMPDAKRVQIYDGTMSVRERPGLDDRLPLVLDFQVNLSGLPVFQPGVHRLRINIGKVRGEYAFAVDAPKPDSGEDGTLLEPVSRG